jgi:hypothetical protein
MTAAKNQEIIWTGNIRGYFEEPESESDLNETYIAIQFNTGRHGSSEPNEERGFGVLFDISASSNPYIFEYRDDGKYVKFDYKTLNQLAGDDFVFDHTPVVNNNSISIPIFINNLTNTENIKFKVKTILIDENTRMVKSYIGYTFGNELPYWTLNNVSKLSEHEDIESEEGFMETVNQGSGYVIARTDNIDTRPSYFRSLTINP